MSKFNELDLCSLRSEKLAGCEDMTLSAIPIIPEGMVDVALRELGAVLSDVVLVDEEIPLYHAEPA